MTDVMKGYHGTDNSNVNSIKNNNFKKREDNNHWLGNGLYFFIDGVGESPDINAEKWAIAESWNNQLHCYTYNVYSVLSCDIMLNKGNILNLTQVSGLNLFNKFREKLINETDMHELKTDYSNYRSDFKLLELLKDKFNINIVIVHVYIKFAKQRIVRLNSRIPNCTILSVSNNTIIDKTSIKEVKRGVIEDAT